MADATTMPAAPPRHTLDEIEAAAAGFDLSRAFAWALGDHAYRAHKSANPTYDDALTIADAAHAVAVAAMTGRAETDEKAVTLAVHAAAVRNAASAMVDALFELSNAADEVAETLPEDDGDDQEDAPELIETEAFDPDALREDREEARRLG